jgi:hypothetical protein
MTNYIMVFSVAPTRQNRMEKSMDQATGTRLELLISWYHKTRCATLRLLGSLSTEDLVWQPERRLPSAQWIFAHIVAREDSQIHRRLRGKALLEDQFVLTYKSETGWQADHSCVARLTGSELRALLTSMKRSTDRFLWRVLRGEQVALSPNLLGVLEKSIHQEIECIGNIKFLQLMMPPKRISPHAVVTSVRGPAQSAKSKGASS